MKIAIIHSFFEEAGGGEKLSLEMYRALRELGHEADLYTAYVDENVWRVLSDGMRDATRPIVLGEPRLARLLRRSGRFFYYRRLVTVDELARPARRLRKNYDIIIETQSNMPLRWADVIYVHYPAIAGFMTAQSQRKGVTWNVYNWLVARKAWSMVDSTRPIMTNSTWTAEHVRSIYGNERVYVVHPPVNVEELSSLAERTKRGKIALTVSRIAPEKEASSASRGGEACPEVEFYLVGTMGPASGPVIQELKRRAEGLSNFHLETDVPRSRILELMSQASIYLHPPFAEHFGIAIAEAAAAGLLPVVYRDGGGWTDIVSRIDEGLGYTSVEEAAHIIRSLLNDPGRLRALSAKAREVAKGFSYERFKERVNEVIRLLTAKGP
ncbi:MAG: Glycosyltransferase [uncultured Acidilobus sp. JCHS]|nr:MAG: Glycosyltransferase [uncultured Acidilobus sp. JCHS]